MDVAGVLAAAGGAAALLLLLAGVALVLLGRGWRPFGASVAVFALGLGMLVVAAAEGFPSRVLTVGGLVVATLGAIALMLTAVARVCVVVSAAARRSERGPL